MIIHNEEYKKNIEDFKKKQDLERIVLNLEKKVPKDKETELELKYLKEGIKELQVSSLSDSHRKYLAEIIMEEKPEFTSNSLILSPVGSGKTTLIKEFLSQKNKKNLLLVSTRFLKDSFNEEKDESSKYLKVMTYHQFGLLMRDSNDFAKEFSTIFCDEIHSLPEYSSYDSDKKTVKIGLEHAMKFLFNKQDGIQIYYFTATDSSLKILAKKRPKLMKDITTYDYRHHPEIRKYMELAKTLITHIEQIRPILKDRLEGFKYFGYKGLAFAQTIKGLKIIEKILIEEGFSPLFLWSDSNEIYKLSKEQEEARAYIIKTGEIPKEYDFLVMNSALREGWDLNDKKVRLAIMNTTNETDIIQARGRIRRNIDLIVYKVSEDFEPLTNGEKIEKYIGKFLLSADKEKLCKELNIRDNRNRLAKWPKVSSILMRHGYEIKNGKKTIGDKRPYGSTIYKKF